MSRRASPGIVGAFVVGAVAIGVAAVLAFGSGRLFETRERMVMVFPGSVQGLSIGAPVILRGVEIGSVVDIRVVIHDRDVRLDVPVYIELVRNAVTVMGEQRGILERVQEFIAERGLRAQLATQSIVTGKLFVNLVLRPDHPAFFRVRQSDAPEMPTIPSEFDEVKNTLSDLVSDVRELPVKEALKEFQATMASIRSLTDSEDLRQAIVNLDATLADLRKLIHSFDGTSEVLEEDAREMLEQTRATMASAERAIDDLNLTLHPGSPLVHQLTRTLEEMRRAASRISTLSDDLSRQPDQLLFGREPEKENR